VISHLPYEDMLRVIAADLGRIYGQHVKEDVHSELLLWWCVNQQYVERYLNPDEPHGQGKLRRALYNHGLGFCLADKAAGEGFEVDDLYWYSKPQVEELLPAVFETELAVLAVQGNSGKVSGSSPANEGGNAQAMVADVSRATARLREEDLNFLRLCYRHQLEWIAIGAMVDVLPKSAEQRHDRCVRRVHALLGGDRPYGMDKWVGTRRAMSNAAAIRMTQRQENQ